jgi:hypothetical protein
MSKTLLTYTLGFCLLGMFAEKAHAQGCPEVTVPPGQTDFCILAETGEAGSTVDLCYASDPTCAAPVQHVSTGESGGNAYFQPGTWTNWIVEPVAYQGYGWSPTYGEIDSPEANTWYYVAFYWLGNE